jgi:N-hydroxyarylamine O-acetyltransferase
LDVKAYLERINYRGPLAPTAETLRGLHVAHMTAVPFENLSIHAHEPVVLEDGALFEKIVGRGRGGFCYEDNGLFAALLRALGFEVSMLSAEVATPEGVFSRPFDHMTLLVTLEERWLADVGFGDLFVEPLLIDERGEQVQGRHAYRVTNDGDYFVMERREEGEWKAQYRFTLRPHVYADFAERCLYQQTSPESHFTKARICSRATEGGGRVTLSGMRFIETDAGGERRERVLADEEEYAAVLREQFGISMGGGA